MTPQVTSFAARSRGRPRRERHALRDRHIALRVTGEEQARLQGMAAAHGLTLSEYLLRGALAPPVMAAPANDTGLPPASPDAPDPRFALTRELRRIGVNLNQLARHSHTVQRFPEGKLAPELAQLERLIGEIDHLLARLT